jgi:ABC-type transport system substrate-binding protein
MAFDRAFEQVQLETDESKKIRLYQYMDSIVTEEAPVISLYYDEVVRLVNKRIEGLNTNPMNLLNLKRVIKR